MKKECKILLFMNMSLSEYDVSVSLYDVHLWVSEGNFSEEIVLRVPIFMLITGVGDDVNHGSRKASQFQCR